MSKVDDIRIAAYDSAKYKVLTRDDGTIEVYRRATADVTASAAERHRRGIQGLNERNAAFYANLYTRQNQE